ncbi:MAG: hypothetical protein JEY96_15360 [Bacteroidales bacterium]|nr:hypothetical protein [Bacteroidales bacterium]
MRNNNFQMLRCLFVMLLSFSITFSTFSQNSESPYEHNKKQAADMQYNIVITTGDYVDNFNKLLEIYKEADEAQISYETVEARVIEPKGEFEKESDYNYRVKSKEQELAKIEREQAELGEEGSLIAGKVYSSMEAYFPYVYFKSIFDKLSIENTIDERLTQIQKYNSEDEFFNVVFKGLTCKINIPINIAQSFKTEYSQVIVYKCISEYWVKYNDSWYKLENETFKNEVSDFYSKEAQVEFINAQKEKIKLLIEDVDTINAIGIGEINLPYPSLFLDLNLLEDYKVLKFRASAQALSELINKIDCYRPYNDDNKIFFTGLIELIRYMPQGEFHYNGWVINVYEKHDGDELGFEFIKGWQSKEINLQFYGPVRDTKINCYTRVDSETKNNSKYIDYIYKLIDGGGSLQNSKEIITSFNKIFEE